jgi:hypothetical protein
MDSRPLTTLCPRPECGHANAADAVACARCGAALPAQRPPRLEENRWLAAPDDLAVYFRARNLKGIFAKQLRIPAGMRAWYLQDNRQEDLPEGSFTVQDFFARLNNFFRAPDGEVLVYRTVGLPVEFDFDSIKSAELCDLAFHGTVQVAVGDLNAFRRHFMRAEGTVGTADLRALLAPNVRQIVLEYVGARRIDEMLKSPSLRADLERALVAGLEKRLRDLGLALGEISALELRHDRLDEQARGKSSTWLLRREGELLVDRERALNEIADQSEWLKIESQEAELRRRYRRGELKQDEAETMFVLRLREIALLDKVANADSRQQAIELGAKDAVEQLEHEYRDSRRTRDQTDFQRDGDAAEQRAQWEHIRSMAQLRRDAELRTWRDRQMADETLERERVEAELDRLRIRNRIDSARLIEDESARVQAQRQQLESQAKAQARDMLLADARLHASLEDLKLSSELKRRDAERAQKAADASQSVAELQPLVDIWLQVKSRKQALDLEAQDKAHRREIEQREVERAADIARRAQEIERINVLGAAPPDVLMALADHPEKVKALARLQMTRVFSGMSAEQIRAAENPASAEAQILREAQERVYTEVLREVREGQRRTDDFLRQQRESHEASTAALLRMAEMQRDAALGTAQANAQAQAGRGAAHTVIAGAVPPQVVVQASAPTAAAIKPCPRCNTLVPTDAAYCVRCGHQFG